MTTSTMEALSPLEWLQAMPNYDDMTDAVVQGLLQNGVDDETASAIDEQLQTLMTSAGILAGVVEGRVACRTGENWELYYLKPEACEAG